MRMIEFSYLCIRIRLSETFLAKSVIFVVYNLRVVCSNMTSDIVLFCKFCSWLFKTMKLYNLLL